MIAEDQVFAHPDALDVVRWLFQVRGHDRPIEDRHRAHVEHVVLADGLPLMLDYRFAGRGIDLWLACEEIDLGLLHVGEVQFTGA